jgi:AraC family transcriptional activator of pobA
MKSKILRNSLSLLNLLEELKADEYILIFLSEGIIKGECKELSILFLPRSILFVPPWVKIYWLDLPPSPLTFQLISFGLNEILNYKSILFLNKLKNHPFNISLNFKHFIFVSHFLRVFDFQLNYANSHPETIQINRNLLYSILFYVDHLVQLKLLNFEFIENPQKDYVYKFFLLVNEHFRKEHSVEFYARELNISKRHLSRTVKEFTKKSPKALLENFLNQEAIFLILKEEKTLYQISDALGFLSYQSFMIFFKKMNGMSPSAYHKLFKKSGFSST